MTSVELPNFVIGLFQNEINKIKINLIKQICKDFYLDEEELIKEYTCDINLINLIANLKNIDVSSLFVYMFDVNNYQNKLFYVYSVYKKLFNWKKKKQDLT